MALTGNGTRVIQNALTQANEVSGYTAPTVTTFTDWEWKKKQTLLVVNSTVDNATPATGMAALVSSLDTTLDAQVANDYDSAKTGTYFHELSDFSLDKQGDALGTGNVSYSCEVSTYVKVT